MSPAQASEVDVVVVGAGFAGLRTLYTLRGQGRSVAVLEAADGIGGVWYWNRYPGARCDIESYDYSYSFSPELEQEWRWTQRYATQQEILRYIEHVAGRFDLRRDIHLRQQVTRCRWDGERARWTVQTAAGGRWESRFLIWAVGNLSATKRPELPGLDSFTGRILHTAEWPHEPVDVTGLRVGVIGTGSSGMQSIPILARTAAHLTVFQRTPNFSVPAMHAAITDEQDAAVKADYAARRARILASPSGLGFRPRKEATLQVAPAEREAAFEQAWNGAGFGFALTFRDILLDEAANAAAADFIRDKIAQIVEDPQVRELLTPRDHPFGAKRPVVDDGYWATFNRGNVSLVDIRSDPIAAADADGLVLASGARHDLDVLIFATGFDAMTGSLLRPETIGRDGLTLRQKWSAGPVTYLGLGSHGFPNMFVIAGPGSPALLINVLVGIELHVDWLATMLADMDARGVTVTEAGAQAERDWGAHLNQRAAETLYPRARSYYMGDEIPGKPRGFMLYSGGLRGYRTILDECAAESYRGFEFAKDEPLETDDTPDDTAETEGNPDPMTEPARRLAPLAERRAALEARHPSWVPRTLHEALDDAAARWPDRPYVVTDAASYSYAEIRDRSLRLARGLAGLGVRPGDHVALEMANYPEFVAAKFAISRTGATTIPVNFLNRDEELAYVLRQSRASVLIVMARFRDLDYTAMLDHIAPGWPAGGGGAALPSLRRVIVFDNDGAGVPDGASTLAQLEATAPDGTGLPPVEPGSVADILYTSGTTGGPKGVQLTHDMLLRTAYGAAYGRGFEDGRRILFALPMYHVFGYVEGMLPALFVGGAIIPQLVSGPAATLAAIERHRATDLLVIPLMTQAVMDAQQDLGQHGQQADISSLASILSSGAVSPPGIWDRIDAELGCEEVTTGYGMSETTASTTVTRPDDGPEKRRTTNGRLRDVGVAGDPALGGRLVLYRAVDPETGRDVGRNAVGELQARGIGVTRGYWDKPEATAAAFTEDGWFRTGDLGIIDDEDYIRLIGRTKDCYRCGGEQVVPKDAEDVLLEHPNVAQALVVPVPDPKMGETGAAFIVRRPGAEVSPEELAEELTALVAGRLARFKVPRHVLFIDAQDIPLTPSGRPRKFLLAQRATTELGLQGSGR